MNKLLKGCFWALAAVVLGFSACSEPVEEETPQQVYFSKDNAGRLDIAVDAKSFDVAVSRVKADGSVRVPITVTADSLADAWFELPDAVEFADAALSAVYTVKVKDGVVLEYDKYAKISIAIAGEHAAALGNAVYSFEVGAPAPWSEWEKIGEGTCYSSVYWSGEQTGLSVYYRECLANDTDAQFCIQGIQNTMNLTVEYNRLTHNCQVLPQYAATNYRYGQVTVTDVPHSPLVAVQGTYEDYPCTYDKDKGLFVFNLAYVVSTQWGGGTDVSLGCGVERFQLDGFVEPDYSLSMQFMGHYLDANGTDNAVISVSKGSGVAKYIMAVVGADENTNATIQRMLAGTVPCDTLTVGGFYACPLTASGNYKALALTFDVNGDLHESYAENFEFWVAADSNPWQPIGYALYTDDVIAPLYNMSVSSYYVKVLENMEQPGLFRIVEPYGPECPMYPQANSYERGRYIDIDATDPDGVWITGWYNTGLDILGDAPVSVTSMAWYKADNLGATKEEVKEVGLCGVYADGVITFPVDGIVVQIGNTAYWGNHNGGFALDMSNLLEAIPDSAGEMAAPAARVEMKFQGEAMGKVSRFKKIDNSFITSM